MKNEEFKEYFDKKCLELGLNNDEALKDFKSYVSQNGEFKLTKANITKFLKVLKAEPENLEKVDKKNGENLEKSGKIFLGYDKNGKPVYR